ncbi:alpha/beta hydrolase [Rhodococcus rhodnii]|nr:alpha/beta fold hydrolase [Rhodococcus rhodnii]TXG92471.1 alpha/beta hydrolase [Rhodococcus rhodnii]
MTQRTDSFTHDGLRFDVRDSGPLDGTPVVLLHGFPQNSRSWDGVAAHLHDAGFRTLVPTQRGYSPDARPRRIRDYRASALVGDVLALLDAAELPNAHVAGHDWGAVVAWHLAAGHPDRVRSLTAVSVPHPAAMARSWTNPRQALSSWYMLAFQIPRLPELALSRPALARKVLVRTGQAPREAERDAELLSDRDVVRGAVNWYRAMMLSSPRALTAKVRVPTTMVWSDGDAAIDATGPERTARYVDAPYRFVTLRGLSHWIPDEGPGVLASLIAETVTSAGR